MVVLDVRIIWSSVRQLERPNRENISSSDSLSKDVRVFGDEVVAEGDSGRRICS
ncbi:hypothetical protein TNIN_149051, partial [Trichonephila inaurata madagascariensis]